MNNFTSEPSEFSTGEKPISSTREGEQHSAGPENGTEQLEHDTPPLYHGVRGLAVKILTRIDRSDAYLDKLLDHTIRYEEMDERDRRLLTEIATGVIRHRERLDWVLTGFYHGEFPKCIPTVKNAMRVALYQILFLDKIPYSAAVNESVELVKRLKGNRSAGIVNGVLRNVIRKLEAITWPNREQDPIHYLAVMESHPQWLVRRWMERLGEGETERLLKANNERPTTSVRVNTARTSAEKLLERLAASGAEGERSPLLPNYLRLRRLADIAGLEAFREGEFIVQDDGIGLITALTDARPGMRVIDLCAAPGGKSIAMAEMMENRGEILALDKYEAKLKLLADGIERSGYSIIRPTIGDARRIRLEPADAVLADVPCSGFGVLRRKPEIKWKREPGDLPELVRLQTDILENAAELVKPGGVLVYGTCTTEPEENEGVVRAFLERHPEFAVESAASVLPESAPVRDIVTDEGFLRTWPHRHGADGAFAARLRRIR